MRFLNEVALDAVSPAGNQNSNAVDASNIVAASLQAVASGSAAGSVKLQGSNDSLIPFGGPAPSNWSDISGATANLSSNKALVAKIDVCYQWLRAVFTSTATGVQTVLAVADTGRKQVQTVTTVADVAGSLNSKYFLLSSVNLVSKAAKNFYVWFSNGAGVDPAVAGRTGIQVTFVNDDTADAVATAIRSALNALTDDFVATGATNAVISTNKAFGLVIVASDGAAPTSFAFANTTPGVASNLNNKYFLLYSGNDAIAYYCWFNVDGIGTDPAVAGKTALPVSISSNTSASTIGGLMATAIQAISAGASFTAVNGSGTVTITNVASGPFTVASDSVPAPTLFTFGLSTPSGSLSVRLKTIGF